MTTDRWASWLLTRRDGEDRALRAAHAPALAAMRDGVLDRADLRPADTLLDVGAGTGLIGLGALDRLGPDGRVIFSDVSADLLAECRRGAGADPRCSFVEAGAEELAGIPDASVDVVTTRSVLIYVSDKETAFAEFRRVLRPGGRLSVFEPINRFMAEQRPDDIFGLATGSPIADLLAKILAVYRPAGEDATSAMLDFDERDLLHWAAGAGFASIELDYRAQLDVPAEPLTDWPAFKNTAPNPLAPTYAEAMETALTTTERARVDEFMQSAEGTTAPRRRTLATAYLRAAL
jgi:arsenite methyltransferase